MTTLSSIIGLRFRRMAGVVLGIAIISTGVGYAWWVNDVLDISDDERNSYDDGVKKFADRPWFPWGKVKRSNDIVIVAIDEKTFSDLKAFPPWRQRYGTWPYDRRLYADVFEFIRAAGAKAIIFDSIIDEPKDDPTGDMALGQSITDNGIPLYLGFNVSARAPPLPKVEPVNHLPPTEPPPHKAPVDPSADAPAPAEDQDEDQDEDEEFPEEPEETATVKQASPETLEKTARLYAFPVETRGGLELPQFPSEVIDDFDGGITQRLSTPVLTIDPVLSTVSGYGSVVVESDEDGKMRKTQFAYTDGVNTYVTLPVAAAADMLKAEKIILEPGLLTIGSKQIPIDSDGTAWIDYGGPLDARYRSVPLVDVLRLRARNDTSLFKDKYVFVAGYALGAADVKATPFERATPGVAKQVAVFDNLMHGRFITDAPLWASLVFTLFVCIFSAALVLIVRNTFVDIAWPVALYVGFYLLTGSFVTITKIHVLSAMPGFAGTIASILATSWERIFANRERERLKQMFAAYMEEDLVELMVEQQELPKLDGNMQRITAFFSDIKGFSSFSELFRDDPKKLMRLLNRYLNVVTPALREHKACIDKYIGDAVVALFGAPVADEHHALSACKGALAVQKAIGQLREELKREGLPDVYTRVGLNTDTLLVGNIGSDQLLDYTAIGDGMNLAARLEAANKAYGTLILMGENTYNDVKQHVVAREVDIVRVAGKKIATRIFELVGLHGDVGETKLNVLRTYAEALELYRARAFTRALEKLEHALSIDQADGPSLTLQRRCQSLIAAPPSPEWDGVSELEK